MATTADIKDALALSEVFAGGLDAYAEKHSGALPPRILIAWTGRPATWVSADGPHGEAPFSELCMHTRAAGRPVRKYALWFKQGVPTWAHIETSDGVVVDGTPHEVIPWGVRADHGL